MLSRFLLCFKNLGRKPMLRRTLQTLFVGGLMAMFASVLVGAEDGPLLADQLRAKKALARGVLYTGSAVALASALGLYSLGPTPLAPLP
jgi:hypothetical protein